MFSGPSDCIDLAAIRRVLVVKLRHHGDVLLTSPLFSALKARAPHLDIDALVYADTREMLSLHPAIAQVHCIDREWKSLGSAARFSAEWRLFSRLRDRGYDLLIHLTEHGRGAWLARGLGCRYAIAPGYRDKPGFWKKSFTHRYALPLNARRHMVELNLDALRRIGVQPGIEERRLVLIPGPEAEAQAETVLAEHGLQGSSFVHLHPVSRWQFKCWPAESMAQLIDALHARGKRVVVTAAPTRAERDMVGTVLARVERQPLDLSGRLSLKALAAIAARASLFIGVDSAPMHIAAAMKTPVVALFGPSGEAEWGPWLVPHRIVASGAHPCRPCGIDGCGGGKISDCLVNLPVARVLDAVDALSSPLS
jgi:heptosyltransferase-3